MCRVPLLGVLLLAACGVGTGEGGSTGKSDVGDVAPSSSSLGKRSLPGYLVGATQQLGSTRLCACWPPPQPACPRLAFSPAGSGA